MIAIQIFMTSRRLGREGRSHGTWSPQVWTMRQVALSLPRQRSDSFDIELRRSPEIEDHIRVDLPNESAFKNHFNQTIQGIKDSLMISMIIAILLFSFLLTNSSLDQIITGFRITCACYQLFVIILYLKTVNKERKAHFGYKGFQALLYLLFTLSVSDTYPKQSNSYGFFLIMTISILLEYMVNGIANYITNKVRIHKLSRQFNVVLTVMKLLILIQFLGVVIALDIESDVYWTIICMPFYLLVILQILAFRFFYKKNLSESNRKILFLELNGKTNRKALFIFTLFSSLMIILEASSFIFAPLLLDGYINNIPLTVVFALFIFYAITTLTIIVYVRKDLYFAARTIAAIIEKSPEDLEAFEREINQKQKEKEIEKGSLRMIRVSGTYFKPYGGEELDQVKMEVKSSKTLPVIGSDSPNSEGNGLEIQAEKSVERSGIAEGGENKCLICFNREADAVVMFCGHGGLCFSCGLELMKQKPECHLCRRRVRKLYQLESENKEKNIYKVIATKSTSNALPRLQDLL